MHVAIALLWRKRGGARRWVLRSFDPADALWSDGSSTGLWLEPNKLQGGASLPFIKPNP